jgi:hypothetical protein
MSDSTFITAIKFRLDPFNMLELENVEYAAMLRMIASETTQ